jgi:hypothetical protein
MDLFTSVSVNFLTQSLSMSFLAILALIAAGFSGGYLMRSLQRNKAKTRILKLEEEMLRNHAKILSLEKTISDLKKDNNQLRGNPVRRSSQESKLHN